MSDREAILGRIREALSVPTSPAVRHGHHAPSAGDDASGVESFLPPVGESHEARVALFAELSTKLKTDFRTVADANEAMATLRAIASEEGWSSIGVHANPIVDQARDTLGLPHVSVDDGYDRDALERCDAGITGCEALIAQTGSVLITSKSSGGRALSVLPPHHVVLARRDQMLSNLAEGYRAVQQRYGDALPSLVGLITGPSRTGDIERIIVLGAHGPKKLTVILMDAN